MSPPTLTPLSTELVDIILRHILPPSQLPSNPIPPQLISRPLRQRHHFLQISTDDPLSYLSWPTESGSHAEAFRILEKLEFSQGLISNLSTSIRYTIDAESALAHVGVPPDSFPALRLVFFSDGAEGWKYHNLSLMPFPSHNHPSIHDALLFKPEDFATERSFSAGLDNGGEENENSYWDAYDGKPDDEDKLGIEVGKESSNDSSEDAYWSQYARIQGSADSSFPSPRPTKAKQEGSDRIIVAYPNPAPAAYNPLAPPSPRDLSRRLADLSPRIKPPGSPLAETDSDTRTDAETVNSSESTVTQPESNETEALRTAIYGLFCLWKAGRAGDHSEKGADARQFLEIVRQVIADD